ncbi:hypothetical protein [Roseovarius sp. Pro17]|uniref:hypothetical protein n=1 Tax=Roseovarius sp. Pro17 TaxID=3108175 RepID=UPI002D78B663|nr:hypothetical protein [Roseovarius sp. Pro17]
MHIFKSVAAAVLILAAGVPAAQADKARVLACYKEVTVPARYDVKKVLLSEPSHKYVRRDGLVLLLEYPAIYREDNRLVEPEHIVLREVVCKK